MCCCSSSNQPGILHVPSQGKQAKAGAAKPRHNEHQGHEEDPIPSHRIKLGEEFLGFGIHIPGISFDVHHGVEVLGPLQGGLSAIPAQGSPRDEELSPGILLGDLEWEETVG